MDLILLGGYSSHNKEWLEEIASSVKEYFNKVEIIYYAHWSTGEEMNFELELARLKDSVLSSKEYCLFAKSAGIIVALKGIKSGLNPKKCFFVGAPLSWARERHMEISELFENHSIPTIFLQKKEDPASSSSELKEFLEENKVDSFQLIEWEGNDHHYGDIDELKKLLVEFCLS